MEVANVVLRDVIDSDLAVFFEVQADAEGARMAAVASRDLAAFTAHWAKIRADEANVLRTILCDGRVAGHVASFVMFGRREIGYWIGAAYWGRGVGSRAVSEFLRIETRRPLYAHVAKHNLASQRIVQKCGFVFVGEDPEPAVLDGVAVPGLNFELA